MWLVYAGRWKASLSWQVGSQFRLAGGWLELDGTLVANSRSKAGNCVERRENLLARNEMDSTK
jgi:hypothetical protein